MELARTIGLIYPCRVFPDRAWGSELSSVRSEGRFSDRSFHQQAPQQCRKHPVCSNRTGRRHPDTWWWGKHKHRRCSHNPHMPPRSCHSTPVWENNIGLHGDAVCRRPMHHRSRLLFPPLPVQTRRTFASRSLTLPWWASELDDANAPGTVKEVQSSRLFTHFLHFLSLPWIADFKDMNEFVSN
jgi:hypothetical protein